MRRLAVFLENVFALTVAAVAVLLASSPYGSAAPTGSPDSSVLPFAKSAVIMSMDREC